MKITKQLKIKAKEDLFRIVKEKKIYPFYRVFQQFIHHNIITQPIYIILVIIECIHIFFEINCENKDFIKQSPNEITNRASKEIFKILQYINYFHFINPLYLSLKSFLIIYTVIALIIILNFVILVLLDYLNRTNLISSKRLKIFHILFGMYNYINMKILIFPFITVLAQSFYIFSFKNENNQNKILNDILINNLTNNSKDYAISRFNGVLIEISAVIISCIYFLTIILCALFYNDLNPIKSKLCWSQSYKEINIIDITIKILLVVMNIINVKFVYFKKVFIVMLYLHKCFYRIIEWYYSTWSNYVFSIFIDFTFLFYNLSMFFDYHVIYKVDVFLLMSIISIFVGVIAVFVIVYIQNKIIGKDFNSFTTETEFCHLIIKLIHLITQLPKDTKTINDPIFFGFLKQHKQYCHNQSCISFIISNLIEQSKSTFTNEIENFEINKNEFNLYCKTNCKNSFEILNDLSKSRCEKIIYSLITCIITFAMHKLPKTKIRLLPILEAYIYIHIFDNKFYALFQIMKYYKATLNYETKFFFFISLNDILEKKNEESNQKFTSTNSIEIVSNYYYYNEKFIIILTRILQQSEKLFNSLINLKPLPEDIIIQSEKIGKNIKKFNDSFKKIMSSNPYEINILRLYLFVVDKIFLMKKAAQQNKIRLSQNLKFYLMNDKFKNTFDNSKNSEIFNKMTIKSFYENSDSSLLIVSGILDNLGKILYSNNLTTSILGYDKKDLIGYSINKIIPQPINRCHNDIILSFYKTGKRKILDHVSNVLVIHKNNTLISIDFFGCTLPSMEHGLMFIGLLRTSSSYKITIDNSTEIKSDNENLSGNIFKVKTNQGQNEFKVDSSFESKDKREKMYTSISPRNRSEERRPSSFNQKFFVKNLIYKMSETGLIILDINYDILHMNTYCLNHFFGLKTCFPPSKVNIIRICKEFYKRKTELENGESIQVVFDLNSLSNYLSDPLEKTYTKDKDLEETSFYNTKKIKYSTITTVKTKNVKISMLKIPVPSKRNSIFYYLMNVSNLTAHEYTSLISESDTISDWGNTYEKAKKDIDSSEASDKLSEQNNNTNDDESNTQENISNLGEIENGSVEKTKEHRVEKFKMNSLNDNYIPKFTQMSNISIYIISVILLIWVIISFIIEISELNSIKDEMKLLNKNESLITVIEYYIIETLLLIRAKMFPFSNNNGLLPIIETAIGAEKNNIYFLLSYISNYYESKQSEVFVNLISKEKIQFKKIINVNEEVEELNMELAIKKMIFYVELLKESDNYKDLSEDDFFDPSYMNSLKSKLHFLYKNFFDNFQKTLQGYSNTVSNHINSDLIHKKNKLLIIFIISLIFGLSMTLILILLFYYKEYFKKELLYFLAGVYDLFYEEKIKLFQTLEFNLKLLREEDQNISRIKHKLETDPDFKYNYLNGIHLLYKNSFETKKTKTNEHSLSKSIVIINNPSLKASSFLNQKKKILKSSSNLNNVNANTSLSFFGVQNQNEDKSFVTLGPKVSMKLSSNNNYKRAPTFQGEDSKKGDDSNKHLDLNSMKRQSEQMKLNKTKNDFIQEEEDNSKANEEQSENDKTEEVEDDDNNEENIKTYTEYNISLNKFSFEIIFSIIVVNSFFIVSLIYLYSYFHSINHIVNTEVLMDYRIQTINNLIIGINFLLLYRDESIGTNITMISLIETINTVEGNFREILNNISHKSNIYSTLLSYDTNDPCVYFSGFNTYYNLITCDEFMTNNGLSFEISQIYNYINIMYGDYTDLSTRNTSIVKEMFNAPELVSIMVKNCFILRLYLTDLSATYSEEYQIEINNDITVIYVKFILYIIILFSLVLVYRLYLMKRIMRMVNNINRVKVFFDDTVFKAKIKSE